MAHFIGFIHTQTDRAVMFEDHFWLNPTWLPKSQIEILREFGTNEVQVLTSAWITKEKKLREGVSHDFSEPEEV